MKHQMITLFLICLGSNLSAEVLKEEAKLSPEQDVCLSEIIQSPIFKELAPDFLGSNPHNNIAPIYQNLMEFCKCTISKRQQEFALKNSKKLEWLFRDRKKQLEAEDSCALSHFNRKIISLYYNVITFSRISNIVQIKLSERYPASMKMVANKNSVQSSLYCMRSKVLERCSKIKSLEITYRCIENHLSNNSMMNSLEKSCPSFSTESSQESFSLDATGPII